MKIASVTIEVTTEEQLRALVDFVHDSGAAIKAPAAKTATGAGESKPDPNQPGVGGIRRRRSYVNNTEAGPKPEADPIEASPEAPSAASAEGSTRRRRRGTTAEKSEATAPATGGRARRPSAAAPEAKAEASADISDEDLTKAASGAGRKIPPKEIVSYLVNEFGVKELGKLPQHKRAEFLAGVQELVARADKAG